MSDTEAEATHADGPDDKHADLSLDEVLETHKAGLFQLFAENAVLHVAVALLIGDKTPERRDLILKIMKVHNASADTTAEFKAFSTEAVKNISELVAGTSAMRKAFAEISPATDTLNRPEDVMASDIRYLGGRSLASQMMLGVLLAELPASRRFDVALQMRSQGQNLAKNLEDDDAGVRGVTDATTNVIDLMTAIDISRERRPRK